MNLARPWRKVFLFVLLSGGLVQNALACHAITSNEQTAKSEGDGRTFVIDIQLDRSGEVHSVHVLSGNGPLRSRAIRAAARRKYKPRPGFSPTATAVAVRFLRGQDWRPEVYEIVLGVSSCVYTSTPVQGPLKSWVDELLSAKPLVPFLLPAQPGPQAPTLGSSDEKTLPLAR